MSLKMDYSKQQIELLEGKANWSTWRFRALILLRGIKKAVDIVEGRLAEPIAPAADANEAARKTYERDLESYSQAEAMALHVLTSNMSRDILLMVMRFTTAREMWLELNRLFDGGDPVEKLYRVGTGGDPVGVPGSGPPHFLSVWGSNCMWTPHFFLFFLFFPCLQNTRCIKLLFSEICVSKMR
jgi:hypothetical protein